MQLGLAFLIFTNMLVFEVTLDKGSQTHIDLRATFKRKYAPRATKLLKNLQIKVNFVKNYYCVSFLDERGPHKCTWGATCGPRAACLRPLDIRTRKR